MKKIRFLIIALFLFAILLNISGACASDIGNNTDANLMNADTIETAKDICLAENKDDIKTSTDIDLAERIKNAAENEEIILEPGTYKANEIGLDKNLTIRGNGDPRNVIIDGEKELGGLFYVHNPKVHVTFKNITFINGLTEEFGGAICINTGNVYVDNCIFINNTALKRTNAGGISNYGTAENKGYLLVNNSLFINNHAEHDGGAITTCYASSYIYNSVFLNNSAHRDGGAIRVSVQGYGYVEDCIFMYNHADEWGGAYYSWSGESNINRCIFINNTAGTHGGAVMASGHLYLTNSIITGNTAGSYGGSFFIRQPMYNKYTEMHVHNNIITDNYSPNGKEVFINWNDIENFYPDFNDNDWGDENPNDSSVNDPDNITNRIKVSQTSTQSKLLDTLNFNLLNRYNDLIGDYFPESYLEDIALNSKNNNPNHKGDYNNANYNKPNMNKNMGKALVKQNDPISKEAIKDTPQNIIGNEDNNTQQTDVKTNLTTSYQNAEIISGNSTAYGDNNKKAYELNEPSSVSKEITFDFKFVIIGVVLIFLLIFIGYRREINKEE